MELWRLKYSALALEANKANVLFVDQAVTGNRGKPQILTFDP